MKNKEAVDLNELLDKKITVHLKGGQKLRGTLTKYDDYMNLVLKNVEEYEKNTPTDKHELIVVKGGNARAITK